jgi:predicted RNase H-like nuclease (RuvC/YqgF family)
MNNKDPYNNFNHFSKKKKKKGGSNKPANFIEALKDLGNSVKKQSREVTEGTARNALEQISGKDSTQEPTTQERTANKGTFNFEEYLRSRDKQIKYKERKRYENRLQQEKAVYNKRDKEIKKQIELLQEEIKKLASETKELNTQVEKTAKQEIVDPGVYHLSFLEHIRKIISLARKRVNESRTWLQAFQSRSKKKSYYWNNVKKSGTKFMLSHERYMVTQKG